MSFPLFHTFFCEEKHTFTFLLNAKVQIDEFRTSKRQKKQLK